MKTGDTILIPLPGTTYDSHLWMVVSDTDQGDECVIISFTSWREDKDQACVVEPGDHPYVSKKTCVNFKDAKRLKISELDLLVASNQLDYHAPLSAHLLQKIRNAVPDSRMNMKCVQLLLDQGLITF